jgi:hypothetical protein
MAKPKRNQLNQKQHISPRVNGYIRRKWNERKARVLAETPADKAVRYTANATVWMAIFTAVLVATSIFTVLILKNQLLEMHSGGVDTHNLADAASQSLSLSERNFVVEQRPYMFIDAYLSEKPAKPSFVRGKKVSWHVQYLNYGRTPAIGFVDYADVYFGRAALSKAYSFMRHTPTTGIPFVTGTVVPPTTKEAVGYTTVSSDGIPSDDDLAVMTSQDASVVLIGRMYYSDVHGNPYYTDFCKTDYQTGAIFDCPEYNEIH